MRQRLARAGLLLMALQAFGVTWGPADEAVRPICPLALHQARTDLDEVRLEVVVAGTKLRAAERILVLLDDLWKEEAVQRIVYLAGKHDRDAARLDLERREFLVTRQQAHLDQIDALCESLKTGSAPKEARSNVQQSHRRYRRADCDAISRSLAIAEVDLEYDREVLASVRDLRENQVATEQEVILAERNLEMTGQRLEDARKRLSRCPRETGEPAAE